MINVLEMFGDVWTLWKKLNKIKTLYSKSVANINCNGEIPKAMALN